MSDVVQPEPLTANGAVQPPQNSYASPSAALGRSIERATAALAGRQNPDGHWVFELEADATIPAEYILLTHFLDRLTNPALEAKLANYLRDIQGAHGGWPLFHDGAFNVSASVKAYFALKLAGDDPGAPHMSRARAAILAAGGAETTNVFTRIQLALYGAVPWRAAPVMPVEIMLLPRWFFFHLSKVSYWSRTVLVPLLVLMALKPQARNPRGVGVSELFRTPPEQIRKWPPKSARGPFNSKWGRAFRRLDRHLRRFEPLIPNRTRQRAIDRAVAWVHPRLNGEDGLGGIYPAMANAVMMYDTLGYPENHPDAVAAWSSIQKLLVEKPDRAYCQPCLSPVWDTALAGHAIAEADNAASPEIDAACAWLRGKQINELRGDWAETRPHAPPGGWAFQYENAYYPDVDDTAVVGMLLHRNGQLDHAEGGNARAISRARDWVIGMQGRDGGWGAFDADNNHDFLNHIPFADHGALLDPSTADVTARCVSFLAQIGLPATHPSIARALTWLRQQQEPDGSWFGRWGTNYIYGTWSVLCALNAAGIPADDPMVANAVAWLLDHQRPDGGWGEDCESYADAPHGDYTTSTPSQTAWALLGLMAAGFADHPAVARGILYLQVSQNADGEWDEAPYTAVGFPRVFYLRYHGYRLFFPLLALARYRNLQRGNSRRVAFGF
jgi:squalene-hopene/tetraprenyl-beta-curcumene cyclase